MDNRTFCEHCDKLTNYYRNKEEVTRTVKDEEITLHIQLPRCMTCKNEVFDLESETAIQNQFFDEYRRRKGLVTTSEIINLRENIGISQRDLSKLLGFGEITISRYELGSLPTKANSTMINSLKKHKNISDLFEQNKDKLSQKAITKIQLYLEDTDPIKYTGNRQYSVDKFHQLTAFIIRLFKENKESAFITKLNKLMFYSDFNFFRKMGRSITGSKYIKLSYGPVPKHYNYKYDMNPYLSVVQTEEYNTYVLKEDIEYTTLSDEELIIAEAVFNYFQGKNGVYISNVSHEEDAWLKTKDGEDISYEESKTLKITV